MSVYHYGTATGLAATGFATGSWVIGGFALVAAGCALLRVTPRRSRARARVR